MTKKERQSDSHFQKIILLYSLCSIAASGPIMAQASDTLPPPQVAPVLAPVNVEIGRGSERTVMGMPFSVSRFYPESARPMVRRTGVADILFGLPGVQVQARNNPTQDARIAVRGFGARSAFGVRGIKILYDGIPVTLPDGQTPIDWIDMERSESVEAIRGTASALYGNASGGVLDFRTRAPSEEESEVTAKYWSTGSSQKLHARISGFRSDNDSALLQGWTAAFSRTMGSGPRDYSKHSSNSFTSRADLHIAGNKLRLHGMFYEMPRGENPGALTLEEMAFSTKLADSQSIARGASKSVRHAHIGAVAERGTEKRGLAAASWIGIRNLDNPLPFAVVDVDRRNSGLWLRGHFTMSHGALSSRVTSGLDVQNVSDHRRNYENCFNRNVSAQCPISNSHIGSLRLDQDEGILSTGLFARYELLLGPKVEIGGAIRYDRIRFSLSDKMVGPSDRDDSGEIVQTSVSPMLSMVWRPTTTFSIYGNINSAFETPTVTELVTKENGEAGLNAHLLPQLTKTAELGMRGLFGSRTWLEMALFQSITRDELIPFDIPEAPGRRAFRNAGKTKRMGTELSARTLLGRAETGVSWTASKFVFQEYVVDGVSFDGNRMPGVPMHYVNAWSTGRAGRFFLTLDVSASSSILVNDSGTEKSAAWSVVGMRAGGEKINFWNIAVSPSLGLDNIFNESYASAILINASRGRYYEPALPRTVYASVRVDFR